MMQSIRAYLYAHHSALALSFRNLSLAPIASLVTIAAIGLCLSLPFGLYLFTQNIQKFCVNWEKGASITVYVDGKTQAQEIQNMIHTASGFSFVKNVTTLSADEALAEFQELSGMNDILQLLPENPIPAVINVQLADPFITQEELATFHQALAQYPQTEQVIFDQAWIHKLQALLSYGKTLSRFLYFIVGLGVIFVIGNLIRLSLEQHRDEMEVLQLIGATKAFIRRPFLYRGAITGCLSGVIATLILSILLLWFKSPTQEVSTLFGNVFKLDYLALSDILTILGIGTLLGWMGALIAFIQQHSALQYSGSNIY